MQTKNCIDENLFRLLLITDPIVGLTIMESFYTFINTEIPLWMAVLPIICWSAVLYFYLSHRHQAQNFVLHKELSSREHQLDHYYSRIQEQDSEISELEDRLEAERKTCTQWQVHASELQARLEEERRSSIEREQLLQSAEDRLSNAFKALSNDALRASQQSFLQMAQSTLTNQQQSVKHDLQLRQQAIDELVKPMAEQLKLVDAKIHQLEKARAVAYEGLMTEIKHLNETNMRLQTEAHHLSSALRQTKTYGAWGQLQLQRVVEHAGMLEYCDFQKEVHAVGEDQNYRPDLVVRLPGNKVIVVDAKLSLASYIDASNASDPDSSEAALRLYAQQIRQHVNSLAKKNYHRLFPNSLDFVILFLPGEHFLGSALQYDPKLIEDSSHANVLIATPITLITMLRAVSYGVQQEKLAQNAEEIRRLGDTLYNRLLTMAGHFQTLGKNLGNAVNSYNSAMSSLESRVLVSARRFKEYGATNDQKALEAPLVVEKAPKLPSLPEAEENSNSPSAFTA